MRHMSELANTHIWRYLKILIGSLIAGLGYSTFIIPFTNLSIIYFNLSNYIKLF